MKNITISLIEPYAAVLENLRKYQEENLIDIEIIELNWHDSRQHMGDYALFRSGPNISGTGVHLLDHLFHLNVLRPFSIAELRDLGDPSLYPKVNWDLGVHGKTVYAIPWLTDVRVVWYRRDLFAKAGIDETTAFATVPDMIETFRKLQVLQGISPWAMPTGPGLTCLQNMAMWVWHQGGQFMSEDGRHPQFMEPEALAGMKQYFSIYNAALHPEAQSFLEEESTDHFRSGKAAAALSGTWMIHPDAQFEPIVKENLGVTNLPVPSFVGGQSLIIWGYFQNHRAAIELVKHMCDPQTQFDMFVNSSYLPARLDVLQHPDFFTHPQLAKAYLEALATGQGFKAKYMWGLAEDKLYAAIDKIWKRLFANPELDLEETIREVMEPIAFQLERMLNP